MCVFNHSPETEKRKYYFFFIFNCYSSLDKFLSIYIFHVIKKFSSFIAAPFLFFLSIYHKNPYDRQLANGTKKIHWRVTRTDEMIKSHRCRRTNPPSVPFTFLFSRIFFQLPGIFCNKLFPSIKL